MSKLSFIFTKVICILCKDTCYFLVNLKMHCLTVFGFWLSPGKDSCHSVYLSIIIVCLSSVGISSFPLQILLFLLIWWWLIEEYNMTQKPLNAFVFNCFSICIILIHLLQDLIFFIKFKCFYILKYILYLYYSL